jgi:NADPH:quinone reductase-like Zn-dependent oxidoreductase
MKAAIYKKYGPPSVLEISEVPKPTSQSHQILIKIMASTVNSADVRLRKADPFLVRLMFGLFKPKKQILGVVFSGVIEEVGSEVNLFKIGDKIFGINDKTLGGYGEYLVVNQDSAVSLMPSNMDFGEAASLVFGGHTALYFLKKSGISKGQSLLVYGASGSVGTSAIQMAKYYQAIVTAVTSTSNLQLMSDLGADNVIDYTTQDLDKIETKYDLVYDTVGKVSVSQLARLVKTDGILALGAAIIKGSILGLWYSKMMKLKLVIGTAEVTNKDLEFLKSLAENGHLKPVVDKIYPLTEIVAAHEYVDQGHKKGNVVIQISPY